MSRYALLSHALDEDTPHYGGGAKGVSIAALKSIERGDSTNMQEWRLSNHVGTHVDAPRHFFDNGKTIDDFNADFWVCRKTAVASVPLNTGRLLEPDDVPASISTGIECLLLKTGFEAFRAEEKYATDNPGISPSLARHLRGRFPHLRFLGMDLISVSRVPERELGRETHRILLDPTGPGSPILPVEDMRLSPIDGDSSIVGLYIMPLMVAGADGAPATVIAELG